MRQALYYGFSLTVWIALSWLRIYSKLINRKKVTNGIAILPYYPVNWPGGNRTTAFKDMFIKDGINAAVFEPWTKNDIEIFLNTDSEIKKYKIYYKILLKRIRLFYKLHKYKAVWVQRAFVPMFPFKHAYFEKLASRFNNNIIYDFYDADYESNYNLVFETVKIARKVTVASIFLKDKFSCHNNNTHFIRFSLNDSEYIEKKTKQDNTIRIGWMGSPHNATQLLHIKSQLQAIDTKHKNVVFSFVCRDIPELGLVKTEKHKWGDKNFNYHEWLASIDIGIVPFIEPTDRVKAKISMKSLEFMVVGIPQVCSEYIHSDKLESGVSCLIAKKHEWENCLDTMITNNDLRIKTESQSKKIYFEYHTYEKVYSELKTIFFEM